MHLQLAGAMVLTALGKPLTTESWEELAFEMMFAPAGIKREDAWPSYAGIRDDIAYIQPMLKVRMPPHKNYPWYNMLTLGPFEKGSKFPDLGGGLRISAGNFGRVLRFMLSGEFLPEKEDLQNYLKPRTNAVTHWHWPATGQRVVAGQWGYAQGAWVHCHAVDDFRRDNNITSSKLSEKQYQKAKELCGEDPQPVVRTSFGYYAAQPVVDFTNGYFMFFMHSWGAERKYFSYISFAVSFGVCWLLLRVISRRELAAKAAGQKRKKA